MAICWPVAPLVGAWIEIASWPPWRADTSVAPLVGAWIEIPKDTGACRPLLSLLSWERGLKSGCTIDRSLPGIVAPLVGAWIEIWYYCRKRMRQGSLLSWERGLKSLCERSALPVSASLLSWERGLKLIIAMCSA